MLSASKGDVIRSARKVEEKTTWVHIFVGWEVADVKRKRKKKKKKKKKKRKKRKERKIQKKGKKKGKKKEERR